MKKPNLLPTESIEDWSAWQAEVETKLKELGYRRYVQNHKREDFTYWKSFYEGK